MTRRRRPGVLLPDRYFHVCPGRFLFRFRFYFRKGGIAGPYFEHDLVETFGMAFQLLISVIGHHLYYPLDDSLSTPFPYSTYSSDTLTVRELKTDMTALASSLSLGRQRELKPHCVTDVLCPLYPVYIQAQSHFLGSISWTNS